MACCTLMALLLRPLFTLLRGRAPDAVTRVDLVPEDRARRVAPVVVLALAEVLLALLVLRSVTLHLGHPAMHHTAGDLVDPGHAATHLRAAGTGTVVALVAAAG
ncbi:MAG: hypothetical protein JWM64_202, partial [Frankiales bacterium]|nr:hypothetical protein [Frankiales bacterium]